MKTKKSTFAEVNAELYKQAERLLNYISLTLKGQKLQIHYEKDSYCTSETDCIFNEEEVRLCFYRSSFQELNGIHITFSNVKSINPYEISILVSPQSDLYLLIPPSIVNGLNRCAEIHEDVEITITGPPELLN